MQEQISGDVQYPVSLAIARPERSSRWLALATLLLFIPKAIMLIPHMIILYFLGIASFVVGVIAQFAVLFMGSYPAGMHEFVVGTLRWQMRMNAFMFGLIDKYPPFSLKD